jgi:hypothetical protein
MNPQALTAQDWESITGRTAEEIRSLVRAGMPTNPDGTFSLIACLAWKLHHDRQKDI